MPDPLVSILIPVYNGKDHLDEALNSIFSQTYPGNRMQIIVYLDGCTDGSADIIHNCIYPSRVSIIEMDENEGIVEALNFCMSLAKGKYFARQDADDLSHPNRIRRQVDFLEGNTDIGIVGTCGRAITVTDSHLCDLPRPPYPQSMHDLQAGICPIIHGSVMFRRKLYEQYGGYDPEYNLIEDYEYWLRMTKSEDVLIDNIQEILYTWRDNIKSSTRGKETQILKKRDRLLKKYGINQ